MDIWQVHPDWTNEQSPLNTVTGGGHLYQWTVGLAGSRRIGGFVSKRGGTMPDYEKGTFEQTRGLRFGDSTGTRLGFESDRTEYRSREELSPRLNSQSVK